ncbi:MAG: hypothetical protein CVU94_07795 [Firmicutes bacterium HGW-Firmicutes-19]|jgi:hypothetical protein|nr:MAG: hypothetical protein CVU94_07795 [Firmicutes bacterium HGW-Firmicutes-19]
MSNLKRTFERNTFVKEDVLSQIVEGNRNRGFNFGWLLAMGLALVLFVSGLQWVNAYASYVAVDINPSIILTTNPWEKVVEVEALNADAEALLVNLELIGLQVDEAVELIIAEATEMGYIDLLAEGEVAMVTAYNRDKVDEKLSEKIRERVQERLENREMAVHVVGHEAVAEQKELANELGVTLGKVLFVQKLMEKYPELGGDELYAMSIKDIMVKIKDLRGNGPDKAALAEKKELLKLRAENAIQERAQEMVQEFREENPGTELTDEEIIRQEVKERIEEIKQNRKGR